MKWKNLLVRALGGAFVLSAVSSTAAFADTKVGVVIPLSGLTSQIGAKV